MTYARIALFSLVGLLIWVGIFVGMNLAFHDLNVALRLFTPAAIGIVAFPFLVLAGEVVRGRPTFQPEPRSAWGGLDPATGRHLGRQAKNKDWEREDRGGLVHRPRRSRSSPRARSPHERLPA
jgi:hypothetical protein